MFLRTRDESLVQVNGTNLFVYLNEKLGRPGTGSTSKADQELTAATEKRSDHKHRARKNIPAHKYNIVSETDDFTRNIGKGFWEEVVNRNRLFYCAHMNRKNQFFKKHFLSHKQLSESEKVSKIMNQIFGFNRIRHQVRDSCV